MRGVLISWDTFVISSVFNRSLFKLDGSRLWRVVQNLYNNAAKYALKDTRVYVELKVEEGWAEFSMKDIIWSSSLMVPPTAQRLLWQFVST